jgi:hypothetical protein
MPPGAFLVMMPHGPAIGGFVSLGKRCGVETGWCDMGSHGPYRSMDPPYREMG